MNPDTLQKAIALRHALHTHPELSMQERWTKAALMDFLRENTRLEIVDRGRWFYAAYRAGAEKPNIAFRADMDAIPVGENSDFAPYASCTPGVGHKCGHDGHSAALAAFAMEVDREGADKNIFFLFQHAEETGQGAAECLPFLQEERIEEIFAVHNLPGLALGSIAAPVGTAQFASTGMTLSFEGQKSHACYPENGKNPAYAISEIVLALAGLNQGKSYRGMTLITVIQVNVGEHAFGTSAGQGELLLTVRGAFQEELEDLLARIESLAQQKAGEQGLKLSVSYEDQFPDTFNHAASVEKILRAAKELNIPIAELPEPFRASEDFGCFTKHVPGAIFYVGDGDIPPIHTAGFDFPDSNIEVIVDMYRRIAGM